jgi:hydrogenase expression/formation protein HypC
MEMCLAIPSKILEIDDIMAFVDVKGARTMVNLMIMPEPVEAGDYVLVHAGFAIQKVDRKAAEEGLKYLDQVVNQLREAGDLDDD